jgi:hypothetical protein
MCAARVETHTQRHSAHAALLRSTGIEWVMAARLDRMTTSQTIELA